MLRLFPKKTTPMEILRTGVSALSAFDPDADDNSREATLRKSIRLTAQMPTLVAAWERIAGASRSMTPNPKLNLAGNFLYMMSGKKPTPLAAKSLRRGPHPPRRPRVQRLHVRRPRDGGDAVRRALGGGLGIGALKGPLHGGANEQVMLMVEKIKDPARAGASSSRPSPTRRGSWASAIACTGWRIRAPST